MSLAPAPRRVDLPDGSVRIVFGAPIMDMGEPQTSLTLRKPTLDECWSIGDPLSYVMDGQGGGMTVIDRKALRAWIGLLMTGCTPEILGARSDLALALLIEESVLDFFTSARRALRTPPESSSPAASPPTPSAG